MDRRSFFKKAGTASAGAVAATALAAPAIAQENPKIAWRMTSSFPKSLDTIYGGAEDIAKHVAAATDGNFTIQPFAAGEIVPGLQAVDAVAAGTVEAAHTTSYYFVGKDPTYAIGTAIPFGLNSRLTNAWYYEGNGNKLMNEFYATQGMYALLKQAIPVRRWAAGSARKSTRSMTSRVSRCVLPVSLSRVMEKVGVIPQQIVYGDIYPALEKGTIDAAEFVGPYDDLKLGFHKVAKYYYYPGWWEGGPTVHGFFNLEKWSSLPKHYQAALTDACAFANTNMLAKYDTKNPTALKQLVAEGATLRPFSQEIMEACFQAATGIYSEISGTNQYFKKIYDDQTAFKRDAYLWMQLSEYTFDTFMMIQQRAGKL